MQASRLPEQVVPAKGQPTAAWRWALVALLLGLTFGTYGWRINDEQDQVAAFHNVAQGSLFVLEHPRQYYDIADGGITWETRFPGKIPVGSTLLDMLGLPVLALVRVADALLPMGVWISVLASAAAYRLLPGNWRTPLMAKAGVVAVPVLAVGFRAPNPDIDLMGPLVALQFTNLLLYACTAYFVARTVARFVAGPGAIPLVAAVVLPLVYWGTRLKYTMLAVFLVALAVWLAGEAPSIRRNLALAFTAAFSIWNNIGEGIVLAGAVGVLLLAELLRNRPLRTKVSLAAPAIGLVVGLLPWAMENMLLRGSPFAASYLFPDSQDSVETVQGSILHFLLAQALALDVWNGWKDFFLNLVDPWTLGYRTEGQPLGVLAMSPLLAAFVLAARPRVARSPEGLLGWTFLLLHAVMLTNRIVRQGFGADARLLVPVLPIVGALAARAAGPWFATWGRTDVRRLAAGATAVFGIAFAAVWIASAAGPLHAGLKMWPTDKSLLLAWCGVLLALGLFALLFARFRLLPWSPRQVGTLLLGALISLPLLWAVSATAAYGTDLRSDTPGQRVSNFLPLAQSVNEAASPVLTPFQFPLVREDNYTVYAPEYGYCDVDPSPCPWGPRPVD